MKKIISITAILALLLSGCMLSGKWNQPDPNMPQELKQKAENAISENLEILEENPEELGALLEVAVNYEQIGNYKEAVNYYEKLIELSPFHYVALNNIAAVYEIVEEYDLAAKYIKTLYEQNQTNTEVTRDTVRILLEADEPDDAQAALENYAKLFKEAGDASEQATISELYESIHAYREQNKE
ncbi:MAG: tetratricopeptide repeat protein [Syntrophales bacterium]